MKTLITLALAFIIAACGAKKDEGQMMADYSATTAAKISSPESSDAPANDLPMQLERKLIKSGTISFETSDSQKARREIEKICKDVKAYISSENQINYDDRLQFNAIIRIPASQFDELIGRIEALASKVESKNINTQDVTEEFIDVEARLKTKKELETRYREILKQAHTVTDILSIESQIGNVRSEIESMEGRLNYLKNQVSYSTLHVTYYEHIGTDFGFGPKFGIALRDGWGNLLTFLIGITNLWPFLILVAGAWWGWRKSRRSKRIKSGGETN